MNAQATVTPKSRKPAAKPIAAEGIGGAAKLPKAVAAKKAPKLTKAQQEAAKPAAVERIKLTLPITASATEINKAIVSIQGRGKKLDVDMHSAACASLHHVTLHNDPTLLNRLVLAMPKAARRNAVMVWAMKFGKVALNDDAKTREERPLVYAKDGVANIDAAQLEPFYALKNVREGGTEWLYMDYIGNVLKTLERHAKGAGVDAARAKAALDALNGVNKALSVPTPAPAGQQERRAVVH